MTKLASEIVARMSDAVGMHPDLHEDTGFIDAGELPSAFAVTDFAAASIAVAAQGVRALAAPGFAHLPKLTVSRRLASAWFRSSIRPTGWSLPPAWDPMAGDYACRDGWIRLHTNAPHHRAAVEAVLGCHGDRADMADAVNRWHGAALESAIVDAGGCAAEMRSADAWRAHPQGSAVAAEPLIRFETGAAAPTPPWRLAPGRPLDGIRVLDLTRVLAGPVATRFLAGYGAEVLRIDPPTWDEPGVVPEVTLGKRCARLDLQSKAGRDHLLRLLGRADVLVHGYRPGALESLGLGAAERRAACPGLVDVALDAYGWSGPWAGRRGFDSLVQMSAGIADAGRAWHGGGAPVPLPVQALDHATGYLMAAAVLRGLHLRRAGGRASSARLSLARTAALLSEYRNDAPPAEHAPETAQDLSAAVEATAWGDARRLRPPATIAGVPMHWGLPARPLGSDAAGWVAAAG